MDINEVNTKFLYYDDYECENHRKKIFKKKVYIQIECTYFKITGIVAVFFPRCNSSQWRRWSHLTPWNSYMLSLFWYFITFISYIYRRFIAMDDLFRYTHKKRKQINGLSLRTPKTIYSWKLQQTNREEANILMY